MNELEKDAIAPATQEQTSRHTNMFRKFLISIDLCGKFEIAPDEVLANYFRLFYASLRTKKGMQII